MHIYIYIYIYIYKIYKKKLLEKNDLALLEAAKA